MEDKRERCKVKIMENKRILVDTSVMIEFLRKKDKTKAVLWFLKEQGYYLFISVITLFELYVGAKTEEQKKELEKILKWIEILVFNNEIALLSAKVFNELKAKNKIIEFRDIFIACTSIVRDIPLCTLNLKHFERVEGLKICNSALIVKKSS